jgi:hypothetical protein
MKLGDVTPGTQVEIGSGRYEVVSHSTSGTTVQKLVQLKSGAWGKRNKTTFTSACEATIPASGRVFDPVGISDADLKGLSN